jgi:hypothetical protein
VYNLAWYLQESRARAGCLDYHGQILPMAVIFMDSEYGFSMVLG